MSEKPILFSGPMVRAILEGRKTQTRRVAKTDGLDLVGPCGLPMTGDVFLVGRDWPGNTVTVKCPFGQPGDRLWVRETWRIARRQDKTLAFGYAADDSWSKLPPQSLPKYWSNRNLPSIHMPRWASRLTLEITAVRVERLQDISEEDAKVEGADFGAWYPARGVFYEPTDEGDIRASSYRDGFGFLWSCIYGHESWDANPWVWVVEFCKVEDKR